MSIPPFSYVINRPSYGYVPAFPYNHHYPPTATYGQIPANNQQQRQPAAQSAAPTAMTQPASGEYSFTPMEMYPQVIQAPVNQPVQQPAATHQKTAPKKSASKAIKIINPVTGKNIFDEDPSINSSSAASSANASGTSSNVSQNVSAEKTVSASHVSDVSKTEAVEEKTSLSTMEPSTPVVSAMTDGPSVDITPKHQVHKVKKM